MGSGVRVAVMTVSPISSCENAVPETEAAAHANAMRRKYSYFDMLNDLSMHARMGLSGRHAARPVSGLSNWNSRSGASPSRARRPSGC
jgi:hypothetical protein